MLCRSLITVPSRKVSLHLHRPGHCPHHLYLHNFYTNTLLHQPLSAETNFCTIYTNELLHKLPFTRITLSTNPHLYQPAFTQTSFYPNLVLLEPPVAPTNFHTNIFLHQPALVFLCPDQVQPKNNPVAGGMPKAINVACIGSSAQQSRYTGTKPCCGLVRLSPHYCARTKA